MGNESYNPRRTPEQEREWREALKDPKFLKVFHNCAVTRRAYDAGATLAETIVLLSTRMQELLDLRATELPPRFVIMSGPDTPRM